MFLVDSDELPADLLANSSVRDLAPRELLYRRGEPATSVYAVLRGRVQLLSCTTEGKQVPLYVARPGECVSEAALFAEVYCSDVVAEVQSRVRAFPKLVLQQTLRESPKLAAEFMALQTERFNWIRTSLELRALRSARERILQYMRTASASNSNTVRMDRPLKRIAEDLSLSHETFYRTLTQLVDEGVVCRTKASLSLRKVTKCTEREAIRSFDD